MTAREREFDFWLGDWDVYDAEGQLSGRNRIRLTAGGRGLREEWRGRSGLRGTSLNIWSDDRRAWHQTWIDSGGTLLLLDGGLTDDSMVMTGTTTTDEAIQHHRITWSVLDGDLDRLRQHWETSTDGQTWKTLFDGRYIRRSRRARR